MTTEYDTKEQALVMACTYAGVGMEALNGIKPKIDQEYSPLDSNHEYPKDVEVYTIKNKHGEDISFAIGRFRKGIDLWLIAKNGMMMRV
jgi:hypothetical protein